MQNRLMQFFQFAHLPEHLQNISRPVALLADLMDKTLPDNAEKTAGLRKLLEAKDCFVRAVLYKEPVPTTTQEAAVEIDQSLFGVKNRYA